MKKLIILSTVLLTGCITNQDELVESWKLCESQLNTKCSLVPIPNEMYSDISRQIKERYLN